MRGGGTYNEEFADTYFVYFETALTVLEIARGLLLLASSWNLKLIKISLYIQMAKQTVMQCGMPIEQDASHLWFSHQFDMLLFIFMYFDFLPSVATIVVSAILSAWSKSFLYDREHMAHDPFWHALSIMLLSINLYLLHIAFNWIGLIFVKSETQRLGHEALLNNFEEGVVILDNEDDSINFVNQAAKSMKILTGKQSLLS